MCIHTFKIIFIVSNILCRINSDSGAAKGRVLTPSVRSEGKNPECEEPGKNLECEEPGKNKSNLITLELSAVALRIMMHKYAHTRRNTHTHTHTNSY